MTSHYSFDQCTEKKTTTVRDWHFSTWIVVQAAASRLHSVWYDYAWWEGTERPRISTCLSRLFNHYHIDHIRKCLANIHIHSSCLVHLGCWSDLFLLCLLTPFDQVIILNSVDLLDGMSLSCACWFWLVFSFRMTVVAKRWWLFISIEWIDVSDRWLELDHDWIYMK
jgi:hypothetical protein